MLMCMCMLNKRGNVLFSYEMWQTLKYLSREKGESVSELIRQAVNNCLLDESEQLMRADALKEIKRIRPHFKGKIDYKAFT